MMWQEAMRLLVEKHKVTLLSEQNEENILILRSMMKIIDEAHQYNSEAVNKMCDLIDDGSKEIQVIRLQMKLATKVSEVMDKLVEKVAGMLVVVH